MDVDDLKTDIEMLKLAIKLEEDFEKKEKLIQVLKEEEKLLMNITDKELKEM